MFAPDGNYSPMSNDVWSLGIILLNLATGRNPWKTATLDDSTFQAYLRSPMDFFPSVLPISRELNEVLVRMLHINWRERLTLPELREMLETIDNFYSDDVIFDGSMARCPWEEGLDIEGDPHGDMEGISDDGLKSCWSEDSMLNPPSTHSTRPPAIAELSHGLPWSVPNAVKAQSPDSMIADHDSTDLAIHEAPSRSYSLHPSPPVTPSISNGVIETLRPTRTHFVDSIFVRPRQQLDRATSRSSSGSSMEVTVDEDLCDLESPPTSPEDSSSSNSIDPCGTPASWIKSGMSGWACSSSGASSTSTDHSSLSGDISFIEPTMAYPDQSHSPAPHSGYGASAHASREFLEGKATFFNPLSIFSRGTPSTSRKFTGESYGHSQSILPQPAQTWLGTAASPAPMYPDVEMGGYQGHRQSSHFAPKRHWFLPGKLFSSPVAS